ncbi:hypothetical protein [Halapricum salinum]|uniref:Transcription antitermination protein n=1 Tax=Halapricum salinum TaxID=1457250 RepID=A0A4D6HAH4_9EURY|nr:hypothetical protein [Halapricum salinum]QCC50216.1 transcription antitermination protein [Halapricum salinum]
MDSIEDRVRAQAATELERLGSDRGLIALTDADLSAETIRSRLAGALAGVGTVYEGWASEDETFATAAESAHELAATAAAGDDVEPATDHPLVSTLGDVEGRPARVGAGLIGVPLVVDGWALQGVSFFVNEADETAADDCREIRAGLDDLLAAGEDAVSESEGEAAADAALDLIAVAYEDYVETLADMGLDPKTVC